MRLQKKRRILNYRTGMWDISTKRSHWFQFDSTIIHIFMQQLCEFHSNFATVAFAENVHEHIHCLLFCIRFEQNSLQFNEIASHSVIGIVQQFLLFNIAETRYNWAVDEQHNRIVDPIIFSATKVQVECIDAHGIAVTASTVNSMKNSRNWYYTSSRRPIIPCKINEQKMHCPHFFSLCYAKFVCESDTRNSMNMNVH